MKLFHSLILFSVLLWSGLQWQSRATWNYRDSHSTNRTVLCNSAAVCYVFVFSLHWQFWGWFEGEEGLGSNIKMMMISYLEARPLLCSTGKTWKHIFTDVYFTMKYQSNDRGINQSNPSRSKMSVRLYKTILSIQLKIESYFFTRLHLCKTV